MTPAARFARVRRRPVVAWWLWALGLSVAASGVATGYASYGLLARPGTLPAGGYAGVVLGLGQLLGRDSSLAVAVATLAAAAAFQPVRRRVQQLADRRFNRHRFDAAQTIQGFSARLRQQVDLEALTLELLAVVEQTMQPTSVSLWLRPSASASPEQRGTGVSRPELLAP